MRTVTVKASKTYEIIIGKDLLDNAGSITTQKLNTENCSAAIITDDNVDKLYSQRLENSLINAGLKVIKYTIPHGEQSKNAVNYINILNFLAENHLTRSDFVFALGGGVVGDLAGFSAATYLRGIHLIQIPTTLLAMVDSSVGGKTGIDLESGKNLAGAFYQPDLVICDYNLLDTLPAHIFSDGFAEVIKYGMICDKDLFDIILNAQVKPLLENIISRCVEIKRDIVTEDEFDTGRRQLLNFGHTFGHAIEKCSNYSISHGKAVAIGMEMITRACVRKGICDIESLHDLSEMLFRYNLPDNTEFKETALYNAILSDKKRSGENITLIIPKTIGECEPLKITIEGVREFIHLAMI